MNERLSSLDASFLYLETPAMHMHVAGVSVFAPREDGPLSYEDVRDVVSSRIHLAPRLRQRVLTVPWNLSRPLWVDDDRFDLEFHVRRAAVPRPGGRHELELAVGRVLSRPLDRSKPLWEMYVFEGLQESRTAVLMKLHHAMADGIAGMLVASALFDLTADTPMDPEVPPWSPEHHPAPIELAVQAVEEMFLHPMAALERIKEAPRRAVGGFFETARGVLDVAGMGRPPTGPFDGHIGPARRFGTLEVPFERVRSIKNALEGTVNDVVVTAVASGLHDQLEARGWATRGATLRLMIPVSVRSKAEQGEVGNRVAPAFVDVPIGSMAPGSRLRRVRKATAALKTSSMAVSADSIIGLGAYAPPALHATAARLVSRGRWFNLVLSNIPAPQVPLYMGGARLEASYPAMPLGERCGLSIACTSLGGTLAFGLTADWDSVKDLDVLVAGIERGIGELEKAASKRSKRR
jgi:WS/DGAT/MGAT family acyltransferase